MDHGGFSSCVASAVTGMKMRAAKQPSEFTDYSSDYSSDFCSEPVSSRGSGSRM